MGGRAQWFLHIFGWKSTICNQILRVLAASETMHIVFIHTPPAHWHSCWVWQIPLTDEKNWKLHVLFENQLVCGLHCFTVKSILLRFTRFLCGEYCGQKIAMWRKWSDIIYKGASLTYHACSQYIQHTCNVQECFRTSLCLSSKPNVWGHIARVFRRARDFYFHTFHWRAKDFLVKTLHVGSSAR